MNRTAAAVGLGLNAKRSTLVLAQADSIRLDMLTVSVLGFRKECTLRPRCLVSECTGIADSSYSRT